MQFLNIFFYRGKEWLSEKIGQHTKHIKCTLKTWFNMSKSFLKPPLQSTVQTISGQVFYFWICYLGLRESVGGLSGFFFSRGTLMSLEYINNVFLRVIFGNTGHAIQIVPLLRFSTFIHIDKQLYYAHTTCITGPTRLVLPREDHNSHETLFSRMKKSL